MDSYSTHICALIRGTVLLPLPLLLLLLQLLDALLQYVGPEVALKVWQLLGAGQPVLCCLLEDVLNDKQGECLSASNGGHAHACPPSYHGIKDILYFPSFKIKKREKAPAAVQQLS